MTKVLRRPREADRKKWTGIRQFYVNPIRLVSALAAADRIVAAEEIDPSLKKSKGDLTSILTVHVNF